MKKNKELKGSVLFDDPILNKKLAKAREAFKEFKGTSALEFLDRK
jgi:hypothetical protein